MLARAARAGGIAVIAGAFVLCSRGANANDATQAARFELFSGGDLLSNSAFGYFGLAWAFGRDVRDEGMRLKLLGGRGGYDYRTTLPGSGGRSSIEGDVSLLQVMAGYQWRRGEWTIKGYLGAAWEDHELSPVDIGNDVRGSEAGLIGQAEIWRNIGSHGFASLDASYTSVFNGYFVQGRVGRKSSQRLSMGVEAAGLGNEEYDSARGGAFVRLHFGSSELTVSGGVSGSYYGGDAGGYAALGLFSRF